MLPRVRAFIATYFPVICGLAAALLLLTWASPAFAADSVPTGAQKALAPVTCSQAQWGGVGGLYREAKMDWIDTHAYWQHRNGCT